MHNHSGGDELTDLVRSIADLLKPWRGQLTQSEVFDEIKCKIYRLKDPTVSSHGNTPFCVIASQLYEAVGGERDCDLIRACRRVRNFR